MPPKKKDEDFVVDIKKLDPFSDDIVEEVFGKKKSIVKKIEKKPKPKKDDDFDALIKSKKEKPRDKWKKDYPEKADTYYFDKILYWKIKNAHTVTIPRDREWFAKVFPVLKETWNKVSYYREHLEELPLVQDLADKRKKFYRYKTDFKVNNIDNKLFLQDEPVKKVYTKSKYTTYKKKTYIAKQENDCDFIDD
jgi:hypothetical protein